METPVKDRTLLVAAAGCAVVVAGVLSWTHAELSALRLDLEEARVSAQSDARLVKVETGLHGRLEGLEEAMDRMGASLEEIGQDSLEDEVVRIVGVTDAIGTVAERNAEGVERLEQRLAQNPAIMQSDMMGPSVQLNGRDTVGSGVVIGSIRQADGTYQIIILTAEHVVRNILAEKAETGDRSVPVTIFNGSDRREVDAIEVASEASHDLSLLSAVSDKPAATVARLLPRERHADRIRVFESIYAVGCPLGNDPIPTRGEIASLKNEVAGANYWMISAPTYYGNSGGGVYLAESHELIGIFSKIYTHGRRRSVVVPHMGLATPLPVIQDWLGAVGYGHLAGNGTPFVAARN